MEATYPPAAADLARLGAHLEQPSRGLWLVKWPLVESRIFNPPVTKS